MSEFFDLMEGRSVNLLGDKVEDDKYWFSEQWLMEPIRFGVRFQCFIDSFKTLYFLGKKKDYKKENNFYKLNKQISQIVLNKVPGNTLFEGYVSFQNEKSNIQTFLKSETLSEDFLNKSEMFLTDLLLCEGEEVFNLPCFYRKNMLCDIFSKTSDHLKIQDGYIKDKKEIFENLKNEIKIFLFKDLDANYSFGQSVACRIHNVTKSYFLVILDYKINEKKEKFRNMILSLEGGQLKNGKLTKIMNIPVNNNEDRVQLFNMKENLKGKVFEILALENFNYKKYQNVRFVKLRDDKNLNDCVF